MRFSFSACLEETHPHPDLVFSVISFTCSCMAFVALASIFNSFASSTEQERRLYASLASASWLLPSPLLPLLLSVVTLVGSLIRTLTVSTWRGCCCSLGMYLRTGLQKTAYGDLLSFTLALWNPFYRCSAFTQFESLGLTNTRVNTHPYLCNQGASRLHDVTHCETISVTLRSHENTFQEQ